MSEHGGTDPRAGDSRESMLEALKDPNDSISTTVNHFLQLFGESEKVNYGTAGGGTEGAQFLVAPFFTILGEERRDGSKMQQVNLSLLAVIREGRPAIVAQIFEGTEREIQTEQRAWIEREQSLGS